MLFFLPKKRLNKSEFLKHIPGMWTECIIMFNRKRWPVKGTCSFYRWNPSWTLAILVWRFVKDSTWFRKKRISTVHFVCFQGAQLHGCIVLVKWTRDLTRVLISPKWWLSKGNLLFQGNLGWWNIIIWPDSCWWFPSPVTLEHEE